MEEVILTPEQVSQILQVHPFTVLKFIKQGKLKASKLGRVYRIRRSDVDVFLDNLTQEPQPEKKASTKKKKKKQEQATKAALSPTDISPEALLTNDSREVALEKAQPLTTLSLEQSSKEENEEMDKGQTVEIITKKDGNHHHKGEDHYVIKLNF